MADSIMSTPESFDEFDQLWYDYKSENVFDPALLPSPCERLDDDEPDPQGLPMITCPTETSDTDALIVQELWNMDRDTVSYLSSIMSRSRDDGNERDDERSWSRIKQELPILKEDHEMMMLKFYERNQGWMSTVNWQSFEFERGVERTAWTAMDLQQNSLLDNRIASERLDVSRAVVDFVCHIHKQLQTDLEDSCDRVEPVLCASVIRDRAITDGQGHQASNNIKHSPPLLPLSPPSVHLKTTALDVGKFDTTSTPEDPTEQEIRDLEDQFLNREALDAHPDPAGATNPHRKANTIAANIALGRHDFSKSVTPTTPSSYRGLEELKLTSPLVAANDPGVQSTGAQVAALRTPINQPIPQPQSDAISLDTAGVNDELGRTLQEFGASVVMDGIERLQKERLMEIDTTLRMSIPQLDDMDLLAPWQKCGGKKGKNQGGSRLDVRRRPVSQFGRECLKGVKRWKGLTMMERGMHWRPFDPVLGLLMLDERLENDAIQAVDIPAWDGPLYTDSYLSEPETLRILETAEDDGDQIASLTPEECPESVCHPGATVVTDEPRATLPTAISRRSKVTEIEIRALLQKRKLGFETQAQARGTQTFKRRTTQPPSALALKPNVSHADGLENFLFLQGQKHCLADDKFGPCGQTEQRLSIPTHVGGPDSVEVVSKQNVPPLPAPSIDTDSAASRLQVVAGLRITSSLALIRGIREALPNLEVIERETSFQLLGRGGTASPRDNQLEADLTLSPALGILLTSLQKLKQKPLPGQTLHYGERDRIAGVAPRYATLTVLVSESRLSNDEDVRLQSLDERDSEALSDLIGWTFQLETDINVVYVAGGQKQLAKWIAGCIVHRRGFSSSAALLEEESVWERVLRVAGMNAFAAQTVLASLRRPEHEAAPAGQVAMCQHGLAAFVAMPAEKRLLKYRSMLGWRGS